MKQDLCPTWYQLLYYPPIPQGWPQHWELRALIFSINVPRFQGFQVKVVIFLSFLCLLIPKRDLNTKEPTTSIEVCPQSLGAMLEY